MGRVTEKIRLTNIFEPTKSVEIEALIDSGATLVSVPLHVVKELNLRKLREATVRYADNRTAERAIYGVVTLEIQGRAGEFDVMAEPDGGRVLVGQIVLDQLDLIIDPSARKVLPNPRSPEMPMIDQF